MLLLCSYVGLRVCALDINAVSSCMYLLRKCVISDFQKTIKRGKNTERQEYQSLGEFFTRNTLQIINQHLRKCKRLVDLYNINCTYTQDQA